MKLFGGWGGERAKQPVAEAPKPMERPELKPMSERTNEEKVAGLTKLVESLKRRHELTVKRLGTENPTNPSERDELTSLEERIAWAELDLNDYRGKVTEEKDFETHTDEVGKKIDEVERQIMDLEFEDYAIYGEIEDDLDRWKPTERQQEIRTRVEQLNQRLKELHLENPLA